MPAENKIYNITTDNICNSISNVDFSTIKLILNDCSLAEIRLDLLDINDNELKDLFRLNKALIATYRKGNETVDSRIEKLLMSISAGADYIDLDLHEEDLLKVRVISEAKKRNVKVIISYHNYEFTPDFESLKEIVNQCIKEGADIVKVACKINCSKDLATISGLYQEFENIMSFGIGELGINSRVLAPLFGAPFTYAFHKLSKPTASGQIEFSLLKEIYKSMGYL